MYDTRDRVGGIWPKSRHEIDGIIRPEMVLNQSRHLVQFSDLAWDASAPQFPPAFLAGEYLERYRKQYCHVDLQLSTTVIDAQLNRDSTWSIQVLQSGKGQTTRQFDYLVMAPGFFGAPKIPSCLPAKPSIPIIHSSQYRNLISLLGQGSIRGTKILVVGGQLSGFEIVDTIATHLSSALHSPHQTEIPDAGRYAIHHLIQRPVWICPLFTTVEKSMSRPRFVPLDFNSGNIAKKVTPLQNTQGHISPEMANITNNTLATVLGTNQAEISPHLAVSTEYMEKPPWVVVSDNYLDFARCGSINVSTGRLSGLDGTTAKLATGATIPDLAAIVLATGFESSKRLDILPEDVLKTINFSPHHQNLPVALAFHNTHHPNIPTLGFVGYYRAPYWGVVEMQARLIAALWSGKQMPKSLRDALDKDRSVQRTLSLRDDPRCSQFPHGDHLFIMQEIAAALDIDLSSLSGFPSTPSITPRLDMDIVTPSRYLRRPYSNEQKIQNICNLSETNQVAHEALDANRFVSRAVFRSLLGTWKLNRTLKSRLPSHQSGRFIGTANFSLREGTKDGRERDYDALNGPNGPGLEYFYEEKGEFQADNGLVFGATRRYVWRYVEARDELSVWFTPDGKTGYEGKQADRLFHVVEFEGDCVQSTLFSDTASYAGKRSENKGKDWINKTPNTSFSTVSGKKKGWMAKARHLCINDTYDVQYQFPFKGVNLEGWEITYTVKGPKKDYSITGMYTR